MNGSSAYETEIVIAGGLAGMVAGYELRGRGRRVLLFDKDRRENFGGTRQRNLSAACA